MECEKDYKCCMKLTSVSFCSLKMEDVHREMFRRNHSMLVRETFPESVAEQLYSDCIFTSEMKETVLVQLTEFAKSRKVLDFLPKRGSKAFHLFCQALEKNNQSHLALQLRQEDDRT